MVDSSRRSEQRQSEEICLSIVLPVFNEVEILETLVAAVEEAVVAAGCRHGIGFVVDGSKEGSGELTDRIAAENPYVRVVHFSRNFGHQAALQAGLLHASGDAVVVMDSDMQDDPASIPDFLQHWREGADVVYAVRCGRKEGPIKRLLFYAFYRMLNMVSAIPIPMDAGNFGLIDRSVAIEVSHLHDRDRYYPGLRRWVGFRHVGVTVQRLSSYADLARVGFWQLVSLVQYAIFSFSSLPLTVFYLIAAISILVCVSLSAFALYHRIFTGEAIPGWTSMTITASFFGAINALGIGVLGEYVVRIYDQVRARPQFIVSSRTNFSDARPTIAALLPSSQQLATERATLLDP